LLRNSLVHFKPRWQSGDSTDKLSERLLQKHFVPNPFTSDGNPFFPDRCLGHGCTKWAWTAALKFADEFFRRLDVEPAYEPFRAEIAH
jgi:hypothetical protein